MDRYLAKYIKQDADKKVVLISGPRQSGKTTLVQQLFNKYDYLNFDASEDRIAIFKKQWKRDVESVLFDELHKMNKWKRWLKGIYDTEGNRPRLLVTGSANLNTFRKVGDSLAGRYFQYRLHPLDIEEGITYWQDKPREVFQRLMQCSGFPEPFLEGSAQYYKRWQKSHLDIILRQDFLDLYSVHSIKLIEILFDLLKPRVSSPIAYANLARDLNVAPKSVQNWLSMLENIYAIFRVTPYHNNVARSLLKEPKLYFYDIGRVVDTGARLENLVACALLKRIEFLEDTRGVTGTLHYLRTKDGVEIDFLVVIDGQPRLCVEVKISDDTPAKNFAHFRKYIGEAQCVQLVLNLKREYDTPDGVQIRDLVTYLSRLSTVVRDDGP
ncbi:MAG: ATP-binding protein [Pseudomonadota bacterium]